MQKVMIFVFCVPIPFGGIHALNADTESPSSRPLEQALHEAGENRPELETALKQVPGSDTEFLIRNASQHDLVNLTADHLIENVRLARTVRDAPFLKGRLSEEMWRRWVLPYRMLEEDLDPWRGRFYTELWPLVEDAGNSGEAATRVLEWLWQIEDDGTGKARFGTSETRNKSPAQILASGEGACRELNLLYVACLRSVGIPARHCSVGWWYQQSNSHYFCEHWDSAEGGWKAWDASDDLATGSESPQARFERGRWKTLRAYAHPGVWRERDLYGTNQWERLTPITESVADTMSVAFVWPEVDRFKVALQVWNLRTWRLAAMAASSPDDGMARFDLIRTSSLEEPVLAVVTGDEGTEVRMRLVDLRECAGGTVTLGDEWLNEGPIFFAVPKDRHP